MFYNRYDLSNNITGIQGRQQDGSYRQQFGYDRLQRLVSDKGSYGEHDFTYDAVGNRLSHRQQSGNQTQEERYRYAPASNRLLGTSNQEITLDELGNLLQESKTTASQNSPAQSDGESQPTATERSYRYNGHNRISEYHENGKLKVRYHYNALGQRIHKAVIQSDGSEQHTLFHYGQNGELLSEIQLDNADSTASGSTQNIVWLHMRPVVALDTDQPHSGNSQITWLHSDHLLTARVATDSGQNLIWRWHSDAFGVGKAESLTANGTVNNDEAAFTFNLRFPGQYYDAENGLHYNYFRTYDPQQGRYTQSDPIGLMGGVNTFAYAGSSPMGLIDWFGLEVYAVFDTAKQVLMITDSDSGKSISVETFSGGYIDEEGQISGVGSGPYLPIPKGEYFIVDNPNPASDSTWFGLFYKDSRIDDYATIDGVERSGMRLHGGSVSHGCVTVNNYHNTVSGYSNPEQQGHDAWLDVRNFILETKTSELEYIKGPHFWNPKGKIPLYGTLIVK